MPSLQTARLFMLYAATGGMMTLGVLTNFAPSALHVAGWAPAGGDGIERMSDEQLMPTIEFDWQFQQALRAERALFFIDVDWSISSKQARQVVYPFVREQRQRDPTMEFYRIDATDQQGAVHEAARHWLRADRSQKWLLYSGAGNILWVRRGELIGETSYGRYLRPRELAEQTAEVWEPAP